MIEFEFQTFQTFQQKNLFPKASPTAGERLERIVREAIAFDNLDSGNQHLGYTPGSIPALQRISTSSQSVDDLPYPIFTSSPYPGHQIDKNHCGLHMPSPSRPLGFSPIARCSSLLPIETAHHLFPCHQSNLISQGEMESRRGDQDSHWRFQSCQTFHQMEAFNSQSNDFCSQHQYTRIEVFLFTQTQNHLICNVQLCAICPT